MIYINGHDLTIEQVIAVSREGETVAIAPEAVERINAARAYVDRKLAEKAVVYGLTTGFGKFSTVFVPEEETAELQRNLIISHACGMGRPLPARVVRAAMLLRLNALSRGNSGIRLSTMETLLAMLNRGVHPVIPEKGSLGASGDLAPLAHMVLVMLGEGEAEYQGRVLFLDYADRQQLYDRINARVDRMIALGLEQEVASLQLPAGSTAAQAIGYKEMLEYFSGMLQFDEAVEKIKTASRNYAKRQLTWFRRRPYCIPLVIEKGKTFKDIVNIALKLLTD